MNGTQFVHYLPQRMRGQLREEELTKAEELRIRVGQPYEILYGDGSRRTGCALSRSELYEMLNYLTGYSLYSLEEEMKQGFFTIPGGHRVGICGHVSYHDTEGDSHADVLRDINGVNIRIARQVKDCARGIIPYIRREDSIYNTLIFSPPGVGKTTYLRDCIRILSSGSDQRLPLKVGVVDERSEIAACHQGVPQNDLGPRTDVMDNCPKELGMAMLLRSMSPDVIAVDELGKASDYRALEQAMRSGVRILGTIHASRKRELYEKAYLSDILRSADWRLVRLERGEQGKRHIIVYNQQEEGIWSN